MTNSWRPDERSGVTIHIPATLVPLLVLLGIAIAVGLAYTVGQNRALRRDVARLSTSSAGWRTEEGELSETIARQHRALREAEGEIEMIRFQVEAIEMQLDGVDFLSRELRQEMGLPPSSGTWSDGAGEESGQGGAYAPVSADRERLALIRRRLAAGLSELYALQQVARARAVGEAPSGAVDVAALVAKGSEPANWPARGEVTSDFGWRAFRGRTDYHSGIDVSLPYGTDVMATGDGIVVGSGWQPGYGRSVLVQHDSGYNTLYAHLSHLLAGLGDRVEPGQVVGLSGSSGNSTGPHLHYEIWMNGQSLDPRPYMDTGGRR